LAGVSHLGPDFRKPAGVAHVGVGLSDLGSPHAGAGLGADPPDNSRAQRRRDRPKFTRHREQRRVIIQPMIAASLKDPHRFTKRRQRFRADFEPQHVPHELRLPPICRPISRREP
jgi:hypothetical protein